MSQRCPVYPRPAKNSLSRWWRTLFQPDNLLRQLSERAYSMRMGESRIAGHRVHLVNDPDAVRKILVESAPDYPKHRFMDDLLRPLLGRSIFTSNGAVWSRQRQLMEPAFERTRMAHAFVPMREAVLALLARLRAVPSGAPCDIEAETTHVTADIILRTIFSRPLDGPQAHEIFDAFAQYQRSAPQATMPRYRPSWLPGFGAERRARQAADKIRDLLRSLIEPRYLAVQAGQAGPEQDILASLLEARDPDSGKALSLEELINEIAVLFLAGHETSASALAWALDLLARAPEFQKAVHAESCQVLGQALPELDSLRHLDLTRRVFRETLRLYPPLSFLVRESSAEGCLRDKTIHPGETLIISPWLIHRHRSHWERPDEFDPDRFLSPQGKASSAQAYLPFSLGPRVCVGAGFALQEAVLVLGMLLREFEFRPIAGHEPMPVARLSLRSDRGIRLQVWHR